MYRNLGLAVLCVFVVTLALFASVTDSILVLLMVVMCIVDVCGFMHFWGVTVDTVSCIFVIIAIGLSVDYSVHIAHAFVSEADDVTGSGGSDERVRKTLVKMGPAVLNGGVSTFLAFVLLAVSRSHLTILFFQN